MIAAPWNIVLTVIFAVTFVLCVTALIQHRKSGSHSEDGGRFSTGDIVHIGHAIMSIAMIAMTWSMENQTLLWIQVVIFIGLALWLVPSLLRSHGRDRIDIITHLILDAAMIWMLAAMELLMAGMSMGEMDMGGEAMDMGVMMATPLWADIVNWIFVVASAAVAIWWLVRWIRDREVHAVCHFLMGGGMALMLVLMNG